MKYLFVDTNNYIFCALLTKSGQAPATIASLKDLSDSNKIRLLLPEVVEIEFFRRVDEVLSTIKNSLDDFKKIIKDKFPGYLEEDKNEFLKSAEIIFKSRKEASSIAKITITELFNCKSTIRIAITPEIFISAFKRVLSGKKPSKYINNEIKNVIDADCLIFESILSILGQLGKIELIFCSDNINDFAEYDKTANKQILHKNLRAEIPSNVSLKYYRFLDELIKSEFKISIKERDFRTLKDTFDLIAHRLKIMEEKALAYDLLKKYYEEQSKYKDILSQTSLDVWEKYKDMFKAFENAQSKFPDLSSSLGTDEKTVKQKEEKKEKDNDKD